MRFFLSKKNVRYHEVVSYNEVQDLFSLLILFAISKILMYEPSGRANMTIKISSNEEFSLLGTPIISSKSFYNHLLTSSLKPICGTYTLMMFKTKFLKTNLIMMIMSSYLLTATTPFFRLLSIKMPTLFLLRSFFMYHNLKHVFSISLAF
jgi:hypothetical protein